MYLQRMKIKDGTVVNRIVPTSKPGAGVTTTRHHVRHEIHYLREGR